MGRNKRISMVSIGTDMRDLDETDITILELLAKNSRQSYSDIGQQVDLSGPAVSNRVQRLQESGIIQQFTINVDRSQLRTGVPILVTVTLHSDDLAEVRDSVIDAEAVEHVFTTAESDLVFHARVRADSIQEWVTQVVGSSRIRDYDVTIVSHVDWTPSIGGTDFALTCAECGNTVTSEGETARIADRIYHFCCPYCQSQFRERYEHIEDASSD